jgi:hypothetical protein
MKLLSLAEYGQAAEKLTMHNPLTFKRAAFISSEDPDVIRDAHNLTTFGVDGATEPSASCTPQKPLILTRSYRSRLSWMLMCNMWDLAAARLERHLMCHALNYVRSVLRVSIAILVVLDISTVQRAQPDRLSSLAPSRSAVPHLTQK